jgi:capsule biosynthesis phosphatase
MTRLVMNIIVPIGGLGTRFKESGYTTPKPLIKALGKEIIRWVIDSLPENANIFIAYNKDLENYNFLNFLHDYYPNVSGFPLEHETCGSAETVKICVDKYFKNKNEPFISVDCDSFVSDQSVYDCYGKNAVVCFESDTDIYSFYKTDPGGYISEVAEKRAISTSAACGIYSFESTVDYLQCYNTVHETKEYYMSTIVSQMIKKKFIVWMFDKKHFNCLGTPVQLRCFCNNVPKIPCSNVSTTRIGQLRICFDLDNTLVTPPVVERDYSTCQPIVKYIDFCNYLKKIGHTIIIHTARRMKTHGGNVGKVTRDIGRITFDTLDRLGIEFDEIYFGKPYADIYIDDKAIDPNFIDIKTGFYNKKIEPRSFNTVSCTSVGIEKLSADLSPEIYYYMNIPDTIKDLFPLLLDYTLPGRYVIENINGITLSEMMTSQGTLSVSIFKAFMESLMRMHACPMPGAAPFNKGDIYSKKLESRGMICDPALVLYESTVHTYTCIHGDPVFTNVMVNNNGKIKFIDPRGIVGSIKTIYGDPMYDWAKVYQSLIGYDFIVMKKPITVDKNLLHLFETYFSKIEMMNIKIICKSHIQSLIPLHDASNADRFMELIKSIQC